VILWLLAFVALALPAPAAEDYARYDLLLSRLMFKQAAVSLEAGSLVEDWHVNRGGLTNGAALKRLKSLLTRSEALAREIEKLAAPSSARTLHAAALMAARGRAGLIREARDHVARGNPTKESQREFLGRNLTATSELQTRWLSERLAAARVAPVQAPRLREYYAWQTQMLPLTRAQVRVGSDVQRLVFLTTKGDEKPLELQRQAGDATTLSFELVEKAASLKPPAALAQAHRQARAEQKALSELCAEIKAYTTAPGEESGARVGRAFRELRQASQAAEQASLDALAAALNAR